MADFLMDELFSKAPEGMFGDEKAEYQEAYGLGVWPDAKLTEVLTYAESDKGFGWTLGLKLDLKGDSMPYTGRINLPQTIDENGDADKYEYFLKRETEKLAIVNRLLTGLGCPHTLKINIDTEDQYGTLARLFSGLVGNACPIKVTADGKNTFTPSEQGTKTNRDGVKGEWAFEATGFTKMDGIRPKKRK